MDFVGTPSFRWRSCRWLLRRRSQRWSGSIKGHQTSTKPQREIKLQIKAHKKELSSCIQRKEHQSIIAYWFFIVLLSCFMGCYSMWIQRRREEWKNRTENIADYQYNTIISLEPLPWRLMMTYIRCLRVASSLFSWTASSADHDS